jgi:site-specific DNA-methyltransferase (adenine-specific)
MKEIPSGSVDSIIADPPYGTTACKWDSVIDLELMWKEVRRIVKPTGAIVMTASQPFTTTLISSNIKEFKFCWVWDKKFAGNFALSKWQPQKIHEDIVVFSNKTLQFNPQTTKRDVVIKKGGNACNWESSSIKHAKDEYKNKIYEYKNPESIIHISSRSENRGLHPTQKPVALMEYLIKSYTNEGEIVLDFTMGSGTTGVACVNTNRKFIGIERDEKYFVLAKNRIESTIAPIFVGESIIIDILHKENDKTLFDMYN